MVAVVKPTLRVAAPSDAPRAPLSIEDALDAGPREVLAAIRLTLAKKLDAGEVASNAIASLSKELREIDRQIRVLDQAAQEAERDSSSAAPRRSFNAAAI